MKSHYLYDDECCAVPTNGNITNNAFFSHFVADFLCLHDQKLKRGKSVNDSYYNVEFRKDCNEKFVVKGTNKNLPRTELMLDWSKSEIKLLINDNYVDNEPASKQKKTKTTKSKSKQKKNTLSTRRSGRTFKSNAKPTKIPKHDLINTGNDV